MFQRKQECIQRTFNKEPSVMLPSLADLLVDYVDAIPRSHHCHVDLSSRKIPDRCRIVQFQGANVLVQALCSIGSRVVFRREADILIVVGGAEAGTFFVPSRFGAR